MENHKERWIEEAMQSLEGLERVSPHPDLLGQIEQKIARRRPLSLRQRMLVAAAVAGLLLLNVWAVSGGSSGNHPLAEERSLETAEEQAYLPNYLIYE